MTQNAGSGTALKQKMRIKYNVLPYVWTYSTYQFVKSIQKPKSNDFGHFLKTAYYGTLKNLESHL
jgi:hypothetical protein